MNEQMQLEAEQMGMTVDEYLANQADLAEMAQAVHGWTQAVKSLTNTVTERTVATLVQIDDMCRRMRDRNNG